MIGNNFTDSIENGIRVGYIDRVLVAHNDFKNEGSFSAVRINNRAHYAYVAHNILRAPYEQLGAIPNDPDTAESGPMVYDGNYLTWGKLDLQHGLHDAVIRNNIFARDQNSPNDDDMEIDHLDSNTAIVDTVWILHNTYLSSNSTNGISNAVLNVTPADHVEAQHLTLENNLRIAPNAAAVQLESNAPLSMFDSINGNVWDPNYATNNRFRIALMKTYSAAAMSMKLSVRHFKHISRC